MDTRQNILDILKTAMQIEIDGHLFYSMTADRTTKPAVRELFGKLAADEVEHQRYLREVTTSYRKQGSSAFDLQRVKPDLTVVSRDIFNQRFRTEAAGASFELGAVSIGMQLETRALAHFRQAAEHSSDKEVRDFYQFLADWEQQHWNSLNDLYSNVREDFWAQNDFAAF